MVTAFELPVKCVEQTNAFLLADAVFEFLQDRLVNAKEFLTDLTFKMVSTSLNTVHIVGQLVSLVAQACTEPVDKVIHCFLS